MTTLYAQPYDISAVGFYFESAEEYYKNAKALKNEYGDPVEEFEIQFIDGEDIDSDLCKAIGVNQANFSDFFDACDSWDENQKLKVIIAVGEEGYRFDLESGDPNDFEIDLYEMDSLKELAEQFVEEGSFGDIPENLKNYIDYEAIARDLGMEYKEARIDGTNYIYRMA